MTKYLTYAMRGLLMFFSMCFTACGIYRQNVINAPLLQRKGELQTSGHISFTGWEGQAAYALTDKFALLANYADMGKNETKFSTYNISTHRHNFKEVGAGFYAKGKSGNTRELFFLAGQGMTSDMTTAGTTSITNVSLKKASYTRYTVQADFGNGARRFNYSLSPRLFAIHYYDIFQDAQHYPGYPGYTSATQTYAEFAFTMRYKVFKFLAITGQHCLTIPLVKLDPYLDISPFNFSVGLLMDLNLGKKEVVNN